MSKLFIENLEIYKSANEIASKIWDIVSKWNYFEQDTIGKQIVRSVDSIALNISEGCGRYHYKDKKRFFYYSRGSIFETYTALSKSNERNLISQNEYDNLSQSLTELAVKLNNYIKTIGK